VLVYNMLEGKPAENYGHHFFKIEIQLSKCCNY
jgi:hypothetical protein